MRTDGWNCLLIVCVLTSMVVGQPDKTEIPEEEITVFGEQRQRLQARKDIRELERLEEELRRRFGLNKMSPSPDRLLDMGVILSACAGLNISTQPTGAEVYLDGQLMGTTPLTKEEIIAGRHVLTMRQTGYELWTSTIMLPPWDTTRIQENLDRRIRYELKTTWNTEGTQPLPSGLAVFKAGQVFVSGGGTVWLWIGGRPDTEFKAKGMTEPRGMGLSAYGRLLYVADPGCHAVWCFQTSTGRLIRKINGAGNVQLHQPTDVAVANDGSILVCDSGNHRLVWFGDDGNLIKIWGEETKLFNHPEGVTIAEDGKVYVADWGNNAIRVLSPDGQSLFSFGSRGIAPGELRGPTGICLEEGGYLLVVDSTNDRVQRFHRDGRVVSVLPEARGLGQFTKPFSAALDPGGSVFVTQRDRNGILVLRQLWEQAYTAELDFPELKPPQLRP